jgi:hypothetical protein
VNEGIFTISFLLKITGFMKFYILACIAFATYNVNAQSLKPLLNPISQVFSMSSIRPTGTVKNKISSVLGPSHPALVLPKEPIAPSYTNIAHYMVHEPIQKLPKEPKKMHRGPVLVEDESMMEDIMGIQK